MSKSKIILTKTGKRRYATQIEYNKRLVSQRRNPAADFWADHHPRRDYGVFANARLHTYRHNGEVKFQ